MFLNCVAILRKRAYCLITIPNKTNDFEATGYAIRTESHRSTRVRSEGSTSLSSTLTEKLGVVVVKPLFL